MSSGYEVKLRITGGFIKSTGGWVHPLSFLDLYLHTVADQLFCDAVRGDDHA